VALLGLTKLLCTGRSTRDGVCGKSTVGLLLDSQHCTPRDRPVQRHYMRSICPNTRRRCLPNNAAFVPLLLTVFKPSPALNQRGFTTMCGLLTPVAKLVCTDGSGGLQEWDEVAVQAVGRHPPAV